MRRLLCVLVLALPGAVVAAPPPGAVPAPPLAELAHTAGAAQGVYAEAEDGTVLVAQAADVAVHPASVSKVATTLALLERLGPTHRFETRLVASGPVRDGTLAGDLRVASGLDPFLVFESAFLMLCRLQALGIQRVSGHVVVDGPLLFNWKPDLDGRRFAAALAGRDGATAWPAVAAAGIAGCPATLPAAALQVAAAASAVAATAPRTLLTHRSPPLLHVVKVLNGYSNNVFHLVSPVIGGPAAVQANARRHVPADWQNEIVIDNGAGGGTTNRLSPRAAVALTRALDRWLHGQGRDLTAALPVSRIDPGTLQSRPEGVPPLRGVIVGKTGTFGSVGASALAGALRTRRYGVVYFAVLNRNVPVPLARARQDAFVRALAAATDAVPWAYDRPTRADFLAASVQ